MELHRDADANFVAQPAWEWGGGFVHIIDANATVRGKACFPSVSSAWFLVWVGLVVGLLLRTGIHRVCGRERFKGFWCPLGTSDLFLVHKRKP